MARVPPAEAAAATGGFQPHVPGIDYGVLDTLIGYGVRRAQIALTEDFLRTLAPWGITPQRFSALTVIARNDGLKLTQLAHILGIARSGAVQVVDALVALGYVERRAAPEDRRAFGLAVTPRGSRDLLAITAAVRAHDRRMQRCFAPAEAETLMRLLERLGEAARASP